MAAVKDTFANRAYVKVVESGANTLTFVEMESGFGLLEKRAWIISRIEYFMTMATIEMVEGAGDLLKMGVCLSNQIADVAVNRPEVVDRMEFIYKSYGVAASGAIQTFPKVHDFSDLPGGGLLLTPKPIYGFIEGVSLANPATCELRIYYTIIALKDADFLQLLEMARMIQ